MLAEVGRTRANAIVGRGRVVAGDPDGFESHPPGRIGREVEDAAELAEEFVVASRADRVLFRLDVRHPLEGTRLENGVEPGG